MPSVVIALYDQTQFILLHNIVVDRAVSAVGGGCGGGGGGAARS